MTYRRKSVKIRPEREALCGSGSRGRSKQCVTGIALWELAAQSVSAVAEYGATRPTISCIKDVVSYQNCRYRRYENWASWSRRKQWAASKWSTRWCSSTRLCTTLPQTRRQVSRTTCSILYRSPEKATNSHKNKKIGNQPYILGCETFKILGSRTQTRLENKNTWHPIARKWSLSHCPSSLNFYERPAIARPFQFLVSVKEKYV